MDSKQMKNYAQKLGISEDFIIKKAIELFRLLKERPAASASTYGESVQIIICLNIAANLKNYGIREEDAYRYTQMSKIKYCKQKRFIEKLLKIEKKLEIRDICTQLGIEKVTNLANDFYNSCKKRLTYEGIDAEHPQYAAMAVYQACKKLKVTIGKTQIREFAGISATQWKQLEELWNKWDIKVDNKEKERKGNQMDVKDDAHTCESNAEEKLVENVVESYECWKQRMLDKAYADLKRLGEL